jgi:hypothetical protein
MMLQGQTDQGTGQDCLDQALHRYPEWLDAGSSMQTEQWLFDDRAEYRFRGGALHLNPFPHRSMTAQPHLRSVSCKRERRDLKKVT